MYGLELETFSSSAMKLNQGTVAILLVICLYGSARRLKRRLILERHVQKYINKQYVNVQIDLRKPDRKTFSLNITIDFFQDINNMRVFGQIYKFADNLYKETALRYEADACVFMDTLQAKMFQTNNDAIFKNYLQRCPIKKRTYWVHNVNETLVSVPFIPLWRAKLDYSFYINNNETLLYHSEVYFQIIEM